MRKNNILDMTIVEQLIAVREDVCGYACKYKEDIDRKYKEETTRKVMIQQYCKDCPLTQLHYQTERKTPSFSYGDISDKSQ